MILNFFNPTLLRNLIKPFPFLNTYNKLNYIRFIQGVPENYGIGRQLLVISRYQYDPISRINQIFVLDLWKQVENWILIIIIRGCVV